MYDVIIIGGGPAGVTAGIYAARKGLKTLLITKDFLGQPAKTAEIDNWPGSPGISGIDLMHGFEQHLRKFTVDIKEELEVISVEKSSVEKSSDIIFTLHAVELNRGLTPLRFQARAVIVATGAAPRKLGVIGEQEFLGKGVSFCSVCDAPFFRDRVVAVAGGGNAGLEAALDLARYSQHIFILEQAKALSADGLLLEKAKQEPKIEILLSKKIKEIRGKKTVEEIEVLDTSSQKTEVLKVKGVFVEIGWSPANDFLGDLVEKNAVGEIIINKATGQTSVKGLFAAGDATDSKYKQVIIAAASGALAALCVHYFLSQKSIN